MGGKRRHNWRKADQGQENSQRPPGARPYTGEGHRLGSDLNGSAGQGHIELTSVDGIERIREGGDGNCFFHAIARQALGDTKKHLQARQEICDWMEAHLPPSAASSGRSDLSEAHRRLIMEQRSEVLAGNGAQDTSDIHVIRYLKKMRREKEWGTGLEALCAAYVYRRAVHVWTPDGAHSELRPPPRLLANAEPILLLHNGKNHWDSGQQREGFKGAAASSPTDEEDTALALALSASLEDAALQQAKDEEFEADAPVFFDPSCDIEERATRRALAVAAAEERQLQLAARGLGPAAAAAERRRAAGLPAPPLAAVLHQEKAQSAPAAPSGGNRWSRRSVTSPESSSGASSSSSGPVTGSTAASSFVLSVDDFEVEALEECRQALLRVGLSQAEALEAISACGGDLHHLKELYGLDWDQEGRTILVPFA